MKWTLHCLVISLLTISAKGTEVVVESSDLVKSIGSGFWNNPNTWDCNCIPSNSTNILIGDDHWVNIDSNAEVNNVHIQNSGGLEFSWFKMVTLEIKGNFIVEGFIDRGFGVVLFSSDSDQRLEGWADFYELVVTGHKTLFISGYVNIEKSIKSDASTLFSEGGLHVWISKSEFLGFESLNGGRITGTTIVHGVLGIVQDIDWPQDLANEKDVIDFELADFKSGIFPKRNSLGSRVIYNVKNLEKRENPRFKEIDIRPLHERLFDKQTEFSSVSNFVQNRN